MNLFGGAAGFPGIFGHDSLDLDFGPQITDIVSYVEQLNSVDTSNVAPAIGGLTQEGERTDSAREDEIEPSLGQKVALAEAPDPAEGHFRVPKVL